VWSDPDGESVGMTSAPRKWPFVIRRCARCTRDAVVVVVADNGSGTISACSEHLEWAFFLDVDEWSGRRHTA
jgi:hypothetical protein